jgi:hypothetical protein
MWLRTWLRLHDAAVWSGDANVDANMARRAMESFIVDYDR